MTKEDLAPAMSVGFSATTPSGGNKFSREELSRDQECASILDLQAGEGKREDLTTRAQTAPAATNDCTRSHPHEAMSAECQVRAVIDEMRSKEARGAEATEHELGEMADRLTQALEAHTPQAAPQPAEHQQEAQSPVAYRHLMDDGWEYYDAPTGDDCPGCEPLYTTPQPAVQQGDAEDAARYRLLRRGQRWSVIDGIGNTLRGDELDAAIDAARKEKS